MEKRIRIVWALSLISMLLLVAGQGYWLWNQYLYKNEEYEEEIHRLVMDAVAVNDKAVYLFFIFLILIQIGRAHVRNPVRT